MERFNELSRTARRRAAGQVTQHIKDDDGRLWANVWDVGFTVPTSFRLIGQDGLEYDLRLASNDVQHHPTTPQPIPEWCRAGVENAHAQF